MVKNSNIWQANMTYRKERAIVACDGMVFDVPSLIKLVKTARYSAPTTTPQFFWYEEHQLHAGVQFARLDGDWE